MTDQERLIEEIVTGVLKQLGTPSQTVCGEKADRQRRSTVTEVEQGVSGSTNRTVQAAVTLSEKVITGELLEERAGGKTRVHVAASAILTPSARDYARTRGIEIVWTSENGADSRGGCWSAVVGSQTDALARALADVALLEAEVSADKPEDLARVAVGEIRNRQAAGVVVFTGNPEGVACLANRNGGIRAAVVADVPSFKRAAARIGANLAAVDPRGRSYFELRNLLKRIIAAGAPQLPADWTEFD